MSAELPIARDRRSCGDCTACCTVIGVADLKKPEWTLCQHCSPKRTSRAVPGCKIYATRPQPCRDYHCLWTLGMGKRTHRPDLLGIIFDVALKTDLQRDLLKAIEVHYDVPAMLAREVWPGAFGTEDGKKALRSIQQRAVVVLVYADPSHARLSKRTVLGPPGVQDTVEEFVVSKLVEAGVIQTEA